MVKKDCTITQRQYTRLKNILETARIKKQINETIPSDRYITLPHNGGKIVLDLEPEDVIKALGEIKLIKQNVATVNRPLSEQELADMNCSNKYRVQPSHNSELSNTISTVVREELPKVLERLKGLNDEKF